MLHEHTFRSMNTGVGAWLWSESPLASVRLAEVETLFVQAEAELSRFRPSSGLSRLNSLAGAGPQSVSAPLQVVLCAALDAASDSNGIFDPTVLEPLRQAGYDQSFELLGTKHGNGFVTPGSKPGPIGWQRIAVDPTAGTVALPAGLGIDLGGIAKGWTVDRVAEHLASWGAALVDAGGDMRATVLPDGEPWPIAMQDPFDETKDLFVIGLVQGAVATSSIGKRRWERHGQAMHHLIDPRSGRPSKSDLHTVTVLASTAAEAEVAAKVALILGRYAGRRYLDQRGLAGILIRVDRRLELVGNLPIMDAVS